MFGMNPQINIDRINQQIQELERMKTGYQNIPQQPTNIINVGNSSQNDFKAQFIDENMKVEDLLVQCKTALICLKKGQLTIKETNGDYTTYEIVIPKTPIELENDELKAKLKEMEMKLNELQFTSTNDEGKSNSNDKQHDKK